jgi:hypothetical protein
MLAQTSIPENPTLIFFFCLSVAVGGPAMIGLMGLSMRSVSRTAKEATENSNQAVGRFIQFCDMIGTKFQDQLEHIGNQNETNINRICKTHEKVGDGIVREMRETRLEVLKRLDQIHNDIRQKPA